MKTENRGGAREGAGRPPLPPPPPKVIIDWGQEVKEISYKKDSHKLTVLKTGIKALEQMQKTSGVDQWLFLQERIEEMLFHIESIKAFRNYKKKVDLKIHVDNINY